MQDNRYQLMRHVQKAIREEYKKSRFLLLFDESGPDSYDSMLYKRLFDEEPTLRSFFAVLSFDYLNQIHQFKLNEKEQAFFKVQLPFIIEGVISVQYYHNHILDEKCGTSEKSHKDVCMLNANLLSLYLERYISKNVPRKYIDALRDTMQHIYTCVNIGQKFEEQCTLYKHWTRKSEMTNNYSRFISHEERKSGNCIDLALEQIQSFFVQDSHNFLRAYLERIYLTNAILYTETSKLIATLLGVKDTGLIKFAGLFGLMKQIINDIADLIPSSACIGTKTRSPEDAFADLKKKNITLPLILHLQEHPRSNTSFFLESSGAWNSLIEKTIAFELVEKLTVFKAMSLSRKIRDIALTYLSSDNDTYILIEDMTTIANNNKFFRYFDKKHTQYKKRYKKLKRAC